MKLHLAEFLRHLNFRPMMILAEHGMMLLPAADKNRRAMFTSFRPMLHQAGKFIFDSVTDVDGDTTTAIKETAFAMLEDKRFHLPYPTTWIEDPFDSDPTSDVRNYYLAYEKDNLIRVWVVIRRAYRLTSISISAHCRLLSTSTNLLWRVTVFRLICRRDILGTIR